MNRFASVVRLCLILALLGPAAAHVPVARAARTPIVFIPGLMGSRLFNNPGNGAEEEVWADVAKVSDLFGESPLMVLGLAADGESPASADAAYATVHTKPGTPGVLTRLTGWGWGVYVDEDFYDTLVRHFAETHGYVENVDFWAFPYDWRKDLRGSADALDALVTAIQAQTGAAQVQIVAHSLGGLLARQYLSDPARAARVQQAVILGTPFLGTPKAFSVLQVGDCLFEIDLILFSICMPEASTIKALTPNYPAFYQVMPSEAYFTVKGGGFYGMGKRVNVAGACPVPTCLSYTDTYVTDRAATLNAAIAEDARQFHLPLDAPASWNGVPVTLLGGTGQQTIVGIREYKAWSWLEFGYVTVYQAVTKPAGDGTVTQLSASLENKPLGVNLRGSASYAAFATDHLGLVKDAAVLGYLDGVLGISAAPSLPLAPLPEAAGVQITASGVRAAHAYDAQGRHTGPATEAGRQAAGVEAAERLPAQKAIPGSAYAVQADGVSLALVGGRPYVITLESAGRGPVDITLVRSMGERTVSTHLYLGLDLPAGARLRMVGDPFVVDGWEVVGAAGGGPGAIGPTSAFVGEITDATPPTVSVSIQRPRGRPGGPAVVSLRGSDEPGGSGLAYIVYALSTDRQPRVYTGPFTLDQPGAALYVMAVDRAGNSSAVSQLPAGD